MDTDKQIKSDEPKPPEGQASINDAEPDFLAGSKACDLSGEGACESCQ
mgnify:CR=1 FL=1